MGQDLIAGICARWRVRQQDCIGVTKEELWQALGNWVDTSIYEWHETADHVEFVIKSDLVLRELKDFLAHQYVLFNRAESDYADNTPTYQAALEAISLCADLPSVMALADERKYFCFQSSDFFQTADINWRIRLSYECEAWGYIGNGKIFMESYTDLFAYLAQMIRLANPHYKIAGAVAMAIVG